MTMKIELKELSDRQIIECAGTLLGDCGMLSAVEFRSLHDQGCLQKIESDGSTRRFWRVNRRGTVLCIIAAPAGTSDAELAESRAAWFIGNHLRKKGAPVPALYGWDCDSGILLYEDLGDLRLHDAVGGVGKAQLEGLRPAAEYYREALTHLAAMQVKGAEGFAEAWCWDSPRYDVALMRDRESGYFLRAFWQGMMGGEVPRGVEEEFREIAVQAGKASADFFLHRDFQSRNIMLKDDRVRFIDFQGGRLGPLGYDVASLLIDPYGKLSLADQEELLEFYLKAAAAERPGVEEDFYKYYRLLALQRNLQIVGAFSFLYRVRGKVFFADFIKPALVSLRDRLAESFFAGFPLIRNLVDRSLAGLKIP